jgi:hypothetical protein
MVWDVAKHRIRQVPSYNAHDCRYDDGDRYGASEEGYENNPFQDRF